MPIVRQSMDWESAQVRSPAASGRLRKRLLIAASAYVAWSSVCLVLYGVQATARDLPPVAADALLLAGGPPLLLWMGFDGAWVTYLALTVVVTTLGGGAVTLWRENVTLAVFLWVWTLLAWLSAALVYWVVWF